MKVMYISSKNMRKTFLSSELPVIQMGTTFEVEKGRNKLAAFCYLNPTTNKTEIAALSMMSDETQENYDFVLSKFKTLCRREDIMFLVDKDFTNIESIKKAFSEVTILLCVFYVLKYMRTLISTAVTRVEKQEAIFRKFKKVVYAHTDDIFKVINSDFLTEIGDIEVRQNGKYTSQSDYYRKDWRLVLQCG